MRNNDFAYYRCCGAKIMNVMNVLVNPLNKDVTELQNVVTEICYINYHNLPLI